MHKLFVAKVTSNPTTKKRGTGDSWERTAKLLLAQGTKKKGKYTYLKEGNRARGKNPLCPKRIPSVIEGGLTGNEKGHPKKVRSVQKKAAPPHRTLA